MVSTKVPVGLPVTDHHLPCIGKAARPTNKRSRSRKNRGQKVGHETSKQSKAIQGTLDSLEIGLFFLGPNWSYCSAITVCLADKSDALLWGGPGSTRIFPWEKYDRFHVCTGRSMSDFLTWADICLMIKMPFFWYPLILENKWATSTYYNVF